MMKMKVTSIVIKGLLVVSGIVGLIMTLAGTGFMGGGTLFLYYTVQSNLWIIIISAIFLVFSIKILRKDVKIANALYVIKFMFTVAISLTFVVFAILLAPMMEIAYLLDPGNVLLHYVVPILAIVDFMLFDYKMEIKLFYCYLPIILPVYYFVFAMICVGLNVTFANGDKFPYFFLNYEENGWLNLNGPSIGVVYWVCIMVVYIYFVSVLFLYFQKKRARKMNLKVDDDSQQDNWGKLKE